MWFAHERGKTYMVTSTAAGKIKHIHNYGRVMLAPYDHVGNVLGTQIEALAHELPPAQHANVNALLTRKYSVQYEVAPSSEADDEDEETFIEIDPVKKHCIGSTRRLSDSNPGSNGPGTLRS